jgi:hypothetical protein
MTLLQEHLLQLHDRRDRSHHSFLILASSLETGLLGLTLGRIGCGLAELIAMAAASLDHDGSTFDTCRVTANAALLSRWAERLHTNDATRAGCSRGKHQVDTDLSVSLNWLSILDRHPDVQSPAGGQADVCLAGDLKTVASGRESFLKYNGSSQGEKECFADYVKAKA